MNLSWNEIRSRAVAFSHEWATAASESADKQTFWNEFFKVFGQERRKVASFENAVRKVRGTVGRIDLFWPKVLIVEHKSRGEDLTRAYNQALDYFDAIDHDELPRYVLVSDFERFRLHDLDENKQVEFPLKELPNNIQRLGFIAGFSHRVFKDQDPVNNLAAERLGRLHDYLEKQNYRGRQLEIFMVRVLFCLFAEDTGIFNRDQFLDYLSNHTAPDGGDLGARLNELFSTLDKAEADRQLNLDPDLAAFPYVNGRLFEQRIDPPTFDREGREALLYCAAFDWSKISPAIFGSLFQSVMNPAERRNLGAHYTGEKNILKVITSLFLDELQAEFERVRHNARQLDQFHLKLASLTFLDPACGSGNFLIIAYRELRRLEIEVLKQKFRHVDGERSLQRVLDVAQLTRLSVEQFYGIELDEFAARVAEVALWMIDHQLNNELGETFGSYFRRLPLRQSPHIVQGNALRLDWASVVPPERLSYILGNPPFVGSKVMSAEQREDIKPVFEPIKGAGVLDYVAAWFVKAANLIRGTDIRCAFVSTNSITQGEQVAILWGHLMAQGLHIQFAHRTFKWTNEARGVAAVYCVVVGFGREALARRRLYDYETPTSEATLLEVAAINPYLVAGEPLIIHKRQTPLGNVPPMSFGNMPNDKNHLLINSRAELDELVAAQPEVQPYIRRLLGAEELINGIERWCLWLVDAPTDMWRRRGPLRDRIEAVRRHRSESTRGQTVRLADTPYLFGERRQPRSEQYIIVPRHSSEIRKYIPIAIIQQNIIVADSAMSIDTESLYLFGHLTSAMHMAWVRYVCGRLESRYRYSKDVVYNNYPWPQAPTAAQVAKVEQCAQAVLDARAAHPGATLADLYDPLAMPPDLRAAHTALDRAVDACYRKEKFGTELERIQFLFELYRQYTAPLLPAEPPVKAKRGRPKGK